MNFLLDTMLLKEIGRSKPHQNVEAWLASVDDLDLAISVITVREIWKGIEKQRTRNPGLGNTLETAANAIFAAYQGRILSIDEAVAVRWGRLLGQSEKNVEDTGLAATALVHRLVLVTRNVSDVLGRGVDVLDPFKQPAQLHKG
ncbi:MAG TPA: type II toxin-antitoxin system VapC family toxin [Acetobacteraceae bacterium]